ncbi:MAG: hypothetical protein WBD31_09475 [Rubripirellula sp.]
MLFKTTSIAVVVLLAFTAGVVADASDQIRVQVVDEQGTPVDGASVIARYLATIRQGEKDFLVPMELSSRQITDKNGHCVLALHDVPWTLAGIHAHRVELTTEEAMKLCDDAPRDAIEREAFDRDLDDRCRRFRSAYQLLDSDADGKTMITLKMTRAIKIAGRVRVNGVPLAKAFVTIHSKKSPIDQLFSLSAPEHTDHEGKFSCYCFPSDLDQARIVAERPSGNRRLVLRDVRPTSTSITTGMMFEFDTDAKDYEVVSQP